MTFGKYYKIIPEPEVKQLTATAKRVKAGNVALLERAGGVKPRKFLSDSECQVLPNLEKHIVRLVREWPFPLPRACHRVLPRQQCAFCKRLLRSGLARLVPSHLVPRDPHSGRVLTGAP